mgnify:FL=1
MVVTIGEKLGEGVDGVPLVGGRLEAECLDDECLIVYSVQFGFLLKRLRLAEHSADTVLESTTIAVVLYALVDDGECETVSVGSRAIAGK